MIEINEVFSTIILMEWADKTYTPEVTELVCEPVYFPEDIFISDGVLPSTAMAEPAESVPVEMGISVDRAFGFVDICGFSKFTAEYGVEVASKSLLHFRDLLRSIATMRGVRLDKWLGDGALLVGVSPGPVIAVLAEMLVRYKAPIRAGVAAGSALLFEADDFIGEPINRAARLCSIAEDNQLLVSPETVPFVPDWTYVEEIGDLNLRSLGLVSGICLIKIKEDLLKKMQVPSMPA